jgi:hypothetical protein
VRRRLEGSPENAATRLSLTASAVRSTGRCPRTTYRELRSTTVATADRLPEPTIRSPPQCPGTDPTEFYIATNRVKHDERVPAVPRDRIPANAMLRERMARKLKTKKGRAVYAGRKAIVEPIFGQIHTRQGKLCCCAGWSKQPRSGT